MIRIFSFLLLWFLSNAFGSEPCTTSKIRGVNVVSPQSKPKSVDFNSVKVINANWISLCPWAFIAPGEPNVFFNIQDNYWGDRPENMKQLIDEARKQDLNILLKPHVWVNGHGWPGDYDLNETGWYFWEVNYASFVIEMARFAEENKIEMYCIGVEFKTAIQKRPEFWENLIEQVREVYSGELIYAANWDNYLHIPFWDKLDYIGIDAYFPLSPESTPDKEKLKNKWSREIKLMSKLAEKHKRKVIFTEYGYRSINQTAWKQWEIENISPDIKPNMQAQVNAYEALYESVWDEPWYAGGFIWKWYIDNSEAGGLKHSGYTPQNKPVEKIIKQWYSK